MNEKGFTLLELLFVLSILALLISIIVPLQFSSYKKLEERLFIEQLHSDVLFIQNQISLQAVDDLRIRFFAEYYVITRRKSGDIKRRYYPEGWDYRENVRTLSFKHTGSYISPGKVLLFTEEGKLLIVFPLGKGRFWVDESQRIYTD